MCVSTWRDGDDDEGGFRASMGKRAMTRRDVMEAKLTNGKRKKAIRVGA